MLRRRSPLSATLLVALAACADDEATVPEPTDSVSVGKISLLPGEKVGGPDRLLTSEDGPRFSGVAYVTAAGWTCSGSFVVPSAQANAEDGPAYVLTAGHCMVGLGPEANEVMLERPLNPKFDVVKFRRFQDSDSHAKQVSAEKVVYATMKGLDIGIMQLTKTRRELRDMGVVPFVLADAALEQGEAMAVAGHPGVGFGYARLSTCIANAPVPLVIEGRYHWYDALGGKCADIVPGSSGSPVLSMASGKIVAVLNTIDDSDAPHAHCRLDAPCEVQPEGIVASPGTSYAMRVAGLNGCFDAHGTFDVQLASCPLDRGEQMLPMDDPEEFYLKQGETGKLDIQLENNGLSHYRFKAGPAASTDCRSPEQFGDVLEWKKSPAISLTLAREEQVSVVCIQAGQGPDPTRGWQDLTQPTVVAVQMFLDPQ